MFRNLIPARDPQIDTSFTDKRRDVRCGKENECDRQVLDQRDVEAGFAPELNVASAEEVEGCLLQAAFCSTGEETSRYCVSTGSGQMRMMVSE